MDIHGFITKKRDGGQHTAEELRSFVMSLSGGEVADYQISAWLMAAYIRGLDDAETAALTAALAESGGPPPRYDVPRPIVDKHSTGGVGDAVTILFLPIMAACGLTVVKMSGRGLGFTGGTLDKVGAIPGFRTDLASEEIEEQAREVGCVQLGQSESLAPADKTLYALRDATETVESIPFIAASVMSKKIAAGTDVIVLDVKTGAGAFVNDEAEARRLAATLVEIGTRAGKKVAALLTDMSQPLAPAVGNALEVRAAIEELRGGCKGRLGTVTLALCDLAAELAGATADPREAVSSGVALETMRRWIHWQGGDPHVVDSPGEWLPCAFVQREVRAETSGIVAAFATDEIGETARNLGAGRQRKEDVIDPAVGIEVCVEIGDEVSPGDSLFTVHAQTESAAEAASERLLQAVTIGNERSAPPALMK